MKKKIFFLSAALAGLMLASCSSDEFEGIQNQDPFTPETPILFSSLKTATTRANATGAEAAALLGNKFVVSGYKGAATTFSTNDPKSSIVFDNYLVEWSENTANTTASNTTNWEYVGKGLIKHAETNGITHQTVKYWDYSKAQYDFIAWSTGSKTAIFEGTPTTGQVLVSAIDPANATGATGAAYTFTGAAADLQGCYIADLVTVKKAQYGDNPVQLTFRNLGTKVRIALYETIPGYSVKDVKFYTDATTGIATGASSTSATLYTTTTNDIYTSGTYTVYFPTVDGTTADNNQAHVKFSGSGAQDTKVSYGPLNYTTNEDVEKVGTELLGRSSTDASFAGDPNANYYTMYLPNEKGTILNLRVDYTLESTDGSGEEITVHGASALVPAQYATWKSNYAYTYIFKISDNTNGWTSVDGDPAGLYPITFDAVVVDSEVNTQSTITTVASTSITTYQLNHDITKDEYAAGDIYVQVMKDGALKTDLGTNGQLYSLSTAATEAEVLEALNIRATTETDPITGRNGLVLTKATSDATITAVPGEDGNDITVNAGEAAKFTAESGKYYAYVYTVVATGTSTDKVEKASLTTEPAIWPTGWFTDAGCTTVAPSPFQAGDYYNKYYVNTNEYGVKVIKVQ